jgi:hypothetical protein
MTIREHLETAADIVGGKAWGVDKLRPRIYMPSRRDMKVYFEFPDCTFTSPDDEANAITQLGGSSLKVFIDDCGQAPAWYDSQRRGVYKKHMMSSLALAAYTLCDDETLARQIIDAEELDDAIVGELDRHIINGRGPAARAVLAGAGPEEVSNG